MGMCGSNWHCRHIGYPPNSCGAGDEETFGGQDVVTDVGTSTLEAECMELDIAASSGSGGSGQSVVRSVHTGGAFVSMADGSVHFVTDFIDSGDFVIGNGISKAQLDPTVFRTWQRLNIAQDDLTVGAEF